MTAATDFTVPLTAKPSKVLYTVGHSNRTEGEFLALLKAYKIDLLADIRRFTGSSKQPQFQQSNLQKLLLENRIRYCYLKSLGGKRAPDENSLNYKWRNPYFRAYADFMETPAFIDAISLLEELALSHCTAIMCSEAVWWRCHRALISDYLKAHGWQVIHIFGPHRADEHSFTSLANIKNGVLSYR